MPGLSSDSHYELILLEMCHPERQTRYFLAFIPVTYRWSLLLYISDVAVLSIASLLFLRLLFLKFDVIVLICKENEKSSGFDRIIM